MEVVCQHRLILSCVLMIIGKAIMKDIEMECGGLKKQEVTLSSLVLKEETREKNFFAEHATTSFQEEALSGVKEKTTTSSFALREESPESFFADSPLFQGETSESIPWGKRTISQFKLQRY